MSRTSRMKNAGGTSTAGNASRSVARREKESKAKAKEKAEAAAQEKRRSSALVQNILNSEAITPAQFLEMSPGDKRSVRYLARVLFVSGAATIPVIARELGVSESLVRYWHGTDRWSTLRKEVYRLASREVVRQNRLAMGRYVRKIDDQLNSILESMGNRITNTSKKVESEGEATRLQLEALRLKIALVRTLAHGTGAKTFMPSPETAIFEGTDVKPLTPGALFSSGGMLPENNVTGMLQAVPEYMRSAARFVLGLDPVEDLSEDMVTALVCALDAAGKSTEEIEEENREFNPLLEEAEEEGVEEVFDVILED